jgi:hypothetical protein
MMRKIKYFKYIYLINKLNNRCYIASVIPSIILICVSGGIINGFVLIRMIDMMSSFEKIFLSSFTFISSSSPLILLLVSGKVFKDSSKLKTELVYRIGKIANVKYAKTLRRKLKSLKPFDVRVWPIEILSHNALNAVVISAIGCLTTILAVYPIKN